MNLWKLKWWVLLTAQSVLLGGCATSALWEEGRFARYREPASQPNLRLFHSAQRQDVLVEYDETRDTDETIRRRAYWLDRNATRLRDRSKPRFVSVKEAEKLTAIPIVAPADAAVAPAGGLYAMASTNVQAFILNSGGKDLGSYELPVYRDASGRTMQVLLTPLAVAADLTIVGGVLAVLALPELWLGLNDVVH